MNRLFKNIFLILIIFINSYNIFAEEKIINAPSGLTLRETPDLIGKKITVIPLNEKVTVLGINNKSVTIDSITGNWVKVSWKNQVGWVFDGYLKSIESKIEKNDKILYCFDSMIINKKIGLTQSEINKLQNTSIIFSDYFTSGEKSSLIDKASSEVLDQFPRYGGGVNGSDSIDFQKAPDYANPPNILKIKILKDEFDSEGKKAIDYAIEISYRLCQ